MKVDVVIIGGGILGLSVAEKINKQKPNLLIVLCEKNEYLGDEVSGRNSGVLHSGIYYDKGSLKSDLTRRGLELWDEYEKTLDLSINRCGKYIVGDDVNEIERLREKGLSNNIEIEDIIRNNEELADVTKLEYSMFVKSTSCVDVPEVIRALEGELERGGVIILKGRNISLDGDLLIDNEIVEAEYIINSAGLGAVDIHRQLGLSLYEKKFVAGNYLALKGKFYNRSLVYPMPNKQMNALGIHTCIAPDGTIFFGPDAQDIDDICYSQKDILIDKFYNELSKTFHGVEKGDLILNFAGIRPRVVIDGKVQKDFIIDSYKFERYRYIELLGIESPGLTCCFSLAEKVYSDFFK